MGNEMTGVAVNDANDENNNDENKVDEDDDDLDESEDDVDLRVDVSFLMTCL
jgi:hypothetical protein